MFADGSRYTGDFHLGEMHGHGELLLAGGAGAYAGAFSHNKFHGTGKFTLPDGGVYEGDFSDHKMTGRGRLAAAGGDAYVGGFDAGRRCGAGVCRYADGSVYEVRGAGLWVRSSSCMRTHGASSAINHMHARLDGGRQLCMHVRSLF